jgi:succinate-acetate transporter protein
MNQTIQNKEWANPTPAGLVALAIACFGFFAILTGMVKPAASPLLGCWLLGGFAVQVLVGIIDLKGGNTTGGNTFIFFSGFFMLASGCEMLLKFFMANSNIIMDARIDGWVWLCITITMYLWTPAFLKSNFFLAMIVLAVDVALPFLAFMDLGVLPRTFSPIAAWPLLVAGLFGIYLASAIIVNTAFGKNIYPMPNPIAYKDNGAGAQSQK